MKENTNVEQTLKLILKRLDSLETEIKHMKTDYEKRIKEYEENDDFDLEDRLIELEYQVFD